MFGLEDRSRIFHDRSVALSLTNRRIKTDPKVV